MSDPGRLLRQLPSVDRLSKEPAVESLRREFGQQLTIEGLRQAISIHRKRILSGEGEPPQDPDLIASASEWLTALVASSLRPVINATGVIVHTNLGRAPLSEEAIQAVSGLASAYSNLEYDIDAGKRGARDSHIGQLVQRLIGAESAFVANNNAAAVLLMLTAFCQGKEVITSRGQLVEIGGGFRIPDVVVQSGCTMVEVGTTNRTHLRDYEAAIGENSAAILYTHHSNYKIIGFAVEPSLAELAELAHRNGLLLLYDQGSGAVLDTGQFGLESEPTVQDGLAAGADVIAFSGDKLLGGPQAGILAGAKDLIVRCKSHPLARAVRPDKLCLAALSATLVSYLKGKALEEIPVWQMIARPASYIERQASQWAEQLSGNGASVSVRAAVSTVGGGSLPGSTLPTMVVAVEDGNLELLSNRLRRQSPPIITRIQDEGLLIDPRTVLPGQEPALLSGVMNAIRQGD